jgi:hypothetical protein
MSTTTKNKTKRTFKEKWEDLLHPERNKPMNPAYPKANVRLLRKMVQWAEAEEAREEALAEKGIYDMDSDRDRRWRQDNWLFLDLDKINGFAELVEAPMYSGVEDDRSYEGYLEKAIVIPDFCTTAYCIAGRVVVDHGWRPVYWMDTPSLREAWRDAQSGADSDHNQMVRILRSYTESGSLNTPYIRHNITGQISTARDIARAILINDGEPIQGYDSNTGERLQETYEVSALFEGQNKASDIRYLAEQIAGQPL